MNLNFLAPINKTGYGYVGLNVLKAFLNSKHLVSTSLFAIGGIEAETQYHELISKGLENSLFFDRNAPSLRIYHQNDLATHVGRGKHIGFPIFELDYLPPHIVHQMNSVDHLFVTSFWAKDVCLENGVTAPIHIVNLGVDKEVFREDPFYGRQDPYGMDKTTVFMNCGKWEYRKGHDVLLKAFERAFSCHDNVKLIMNCYNPCSWMIPKNYNSDWETLYRSSKLANKIEINKARFHNQADVVRMMNSADCGVFPSRAEGWNLELLEMMALGKYVIATEYSAHNEYCSNDNCMLVTPSGKEQAFDGVFFKDQQEKGQWAELNDNCVDQIAHWMRHVHDVKQMGNICYNEKGLATANSLSWDHTVEQMLEVLK